MNKEEELSRYMVLVERYKEQIKQLEMQSNYLQNAINEYNMAKVTLDQLSKQEKEIDSIIPIGGGSYINATLKDTSKVLFDIGSGIVTEKTFDDAIKKIDERIENINKTRERVQSMIQQVESEASQISNKAQELMSEQEQ